MKKLISCILVVIMALGMVSCSKEGGTDESTRPTVNTEAKLREIRNWLVSDIWNDGICDISHYYYDGKDSCGQTMDIEFTISQLGKEMELKVEYDKFMSELPDEYRELSEIWVKLTEQIDILYADILRQGTAIGGELDTGLYQQYFDAFDKEFYEIINRKS